MDSGNVFLPLKEEISMQNEYFALQCEVNTSHLRKGL